MNTRSLSIAQVVVLVFTSIGVATDWPQWRGPDRSNVSTETGLLKEWPKDGPPLVWTANGLGDGVAPVSVARGRVFTTGNIGDAVVCTARSETDGKPLWSTTLGPAAKEASVMRWLSQTAPTVDAERVYAVTANGDYVCLAADTGKEVWRKHFATDLGGRKGSWGFCDYPLVDGENLIVSPGGTAGTITSLNKKTGAINWKCSLPGGDTHGHSVLIAAEIAGTRQYITHLAKWMVGVSAKDGTLLWKIDDMKTVIATTHAPIVRGESVFYASGYKAGHIQFTLSRASNGWHVQNLYRDVNNNYVPWLGSPTRVGDFIYISTMTGLQCLAWNTGKPSWSDTTLGRCMYTIADGMLIVREQKGPVSLAAVDPKTFVSVSKFTPPRPDKGVPAWTFPVVANGRLYIRDYDTLLCYDICDPERHKNKAPDAVFVPTPHDVANQMLDLVKVTKDDIVYDLGSGDGRIVIAAAKRFGCKSVGVEIEKDLVKTARERAVKAGVEKQVAFEQADLFEADFSSASANRSCGNCNQNCATTHAANKVGRRRAILVLNIFEDLKPCGLRRSA